jgi:hypothetical protein
MIGRTCFDLANCILYTVCVRHCNDSVSRTMSSASSGR